jgi:hypothetical protein
MIDDVLEEHMPMLFESTAIKQMTLADYISLSRPLIREPHLINRWKSGDMRKATCQSDNLCFDPAVLGEGIHCVVEGRKA